MRPNGAYKLLIILQQGLHPQVFTRSQGGRIKVLTIRGLARLVGTESARVRFWLTFLRDSGYIGPIEYSYNLRQCEFSINAGTIE